MNVEETLTWRGEEYSEYCTGHVNSWQKNSSGSLNLIESVGGNGETEF